MAKGRGQTKGESPQEQDFNLDLLYKFSPAVQSRLDASLRYLDKSERRMLKEMRRYKKGSMRWHVSALWVQSFRNEKDAYRSDAILLRTLFFLFEKSQKRVSVLARRRFNGLVKELLGSITKRENESKRRYINRNLGGTKR